MYNLEKTREPDRESGSKRERRVEAGQHSKTSLAINSIYHRSRQAGTFVAPEIGWRRDD